MSLFKTIDTVKFNVNTLFEGHRKVTYKGVEALKCPFDYVIYQMIFFEVKPDLIIEVGTNKGGGALYIADLLDLIGNGEVHTIDIQDTCHEKSKTHPRIKRFTDGWEGYDLKNAEGFSKILIIEDGSHLYEHTRDILFKFWKLVTKDSYFIIEDSIITELNFTKDYNGGPLKAIHEFLKQNNHFEIDRKWCDFFGKNATFNVNGYLKRIK